MDQKLVFFCYLAAAACFLLAAMGGTRKGSAGQPSALLPLGLLLWLLPQLWDAASAAFR